MTHNPETPRYPLGETERHELKSASGRALADLDMQAVVHGDIAAQDLRIHAGTLRAQAEIARQSGFDRLAGNLLRAAELSNVPNNELLKMYEALRPGRSTFQELETLASLLETNYGAAFTARFVLEAAEVYRKRGLLKK